MKIRVIMCPANRAPYTCWIENSLSNMQRIVGGYIVTVNIAEDAVIVCNDEGRLIGLPENKSLPVRGFCGDCFICGADGEEFASLQENAKRFLLRKCRDSWNVLREEAHGN